MNLHSFNCSNEFKDFIKKIQKYHSVQKERTIKYFMAEEK